MVKKDTLNTGELFILEAARIDPDQAALDRMNNMIPSVSNWDYVVRIAIDNGMAPLVNDKLPRLENSILIPVGAKSKLQQAYLKTLSRNLVIYDHFRKVANALYTENIPVIALKGIYLSEFLYKDIGLRQLSDIDLLIQEKDANKCLGMLEDFGYDPHFVKTEFIRDSTDHHHFAPMVLNGVSIEIHTKLYRNSMPFRVDVENIWTNAKASIIYNTPVHVMDISNLLLHLCLHLDKHFSTGKVQFTCYCDITNILVHYENDIDWEKISLLCGEYNCTGNFFKHINLSNKYFNAPVPEQILSRHIISCDQSDESQFITYLRRRSAIVSKRKNIQLIGEVDGFFRKIRYILHDTFPSRKYMFERYNIKRRRLVWFFYFYRIYLGFRQAIGYLIKMISGKS